MEAEKYTSLLERLETEIPLWPPDKCSQILGILERLRVTAWARVLGEGISTKTSSRQDSGQLLTLPQVAERLAVPETYAYELARQHRLPVVRLGKYVRVPVQEFEKWVAQQASLERRIDSEPYAFHSALGRKRCVTGLRALKKNDRASSKSPPKKPVGFRPPVATPCSSAESGTVEAPTSDKEG